MADQAAWGKDGCRPAIQAAKEFSGDATKVGWLPSQRSAAVWQAFVGGVRNVIISETPGLGDGQPFVLHSAAKPIAVKVSLGDAARPQKVELWDAHTRLAERVTAPWTFEVTLKPGIHSLIAIVREADQSARTSRPHTIVVAD